MKQLELNVRQQLNVSALLGQQKGNVSQIRLASRIMDKVELAPAEREAVAYEVDGATIRWSPAREAAVPPAGSNWKMRRRDTSSRCPTLAWVRARRYPVA